MGKRQRRRKREQSKRKRIAPAPVIVEIPCDAPRIRVVIKAGQPQKVQEIAATYWEIAEDGKWARTVASIGEQQWVAATATSVSYAILLNSLCVDCDEPIRVTNRSEAVKVGGKYLDRLNDKYLCPECGDIHRQEQKRKQELRTETARAEKAREKEQAEQEACKIAEVLANEDAEDGSRSQLLNSSPTGLLLYLALVNHAAYRPSEPLPSVADLLTSSLISSSFKASSKK